MNDFVEQCRHEWKRLGVPDPLAEEMATDLTHDLQEAEAEGVSTEQLLGSVAFDPPAFAATWATARGIVRRPPSPQNTRRRPLIVIALTVVAAITVAVVALQLFQGGSGVAPRGRENPPHRVSPPAGFAPPSNPGHPTNGSTPAELILLFPAIIALGVASWLWSRSRSRPPTGLA
jgi:hypothetical protein